MDTLIPHRWLVCIQGYGGQKDKPSLYVIDPTKLEEEIRFLLIKYREKSWEEIETIYCETKADQEDEEEYNKKEEEFMVAFRSAATKETCGYVVVDTFIFRATKR